MANILYYKMTVLTRAQVSKNLFTSLFLNDGRAVLKFLSIENSQAAEAPHLVVCVKDTFHRFVIVEFSAHLHGLNVDGASVNLGIHKVLQRY